VRQHNIGLKQMLVNNVVLMRYIKRLGYLNELI